jgi:hypothetical protein
MGIPIESISLPTGADAILLPFFSFSISITLPPEKIKIVQLIEIWIYAD